ncbi:hypothetical protein [Saccharicrinis sp. FJH54]|uniref:hypothetical protein n=1 Tax=Saccharicrinis sp. FJH54 TaxID=3344665 RepID=UPI0035D515C9
MLKDRPEVFLLLLVIVSCSPSVSTKISSEYAPLKYDEDVVVLGLKDTVPEDAVEIGTVKIGDSGFTTNCDYQTVMNEAIIEARKAGGNILKLDKHLPPSEMGTTCHRITARILRTDNLEQLKADISPESEINCDYAIINIYRYRSSTFPVDYDLYLDESLLCSVTNNFCQSVIVRKEGNLILSARTETKTELPISIEFGRTYFLKCGLTSGIMVGRPKLELVDIQTGWTEFNSIKASIK